MDKCEKIHSVTKTIEEACDRFCKEYCKHNEGFENGTYTDGDFERICGDCPMLELI